MVDSGEEGSRAWVALRREPLRRSAYLMCGGWYLADDLVEDAMARLYAVWHHLLGRTLLQNQFGSQPPHRRPAAAAPGYYCRWK